ncbi:3'-5' exoribonuclease domain-containing protein [Actinosynnema sp. NPDC059335]|uniref:3'-5' exoribonuclease domain-containing protein n=1 Tax=Actinosynnema sp. NPDC059335 TaxID=3346804 RepID=UPI003673213F
MRFFYDTEFLEDGRTIELISIGIVCEDGREYYAVNSDMPVDRIRSERWLMNNVVRHLPLRVPIPERAWADNQTPAVVLDLRDTRVKPKWVIANEVREFILGPRDSDDLPYVELWAWYSAYDHVALAQLWGRMIDLPEGMPMFTRDLKQECARLGDPRLPDQLEGEHDALADARQNLVRWQALQEIEAKGNS